MSGNDSNSVPRSIFDKKKRAIEGVSIAILFALILSGCGGANNKTPLVEEELTSTPISTPTTNSSPSQIGTTGLAFTRLDNVGFTRQVRGNLEEYTDAEKFGGGIAAGDFDNDGDTDLYIVGRDSMPNHLYENQGDGTFVEVGAEWGVDVQHWGSGPAWGDIDGDGDLDLFVGSVMSTAIFLFENLLAQGERRFVEITRESEIRTKGANTVSATWHDYDLDGHIDLFLTHWGAGWSEGVDTERLWRNNGNKTFTSVSKQTGLAVVESRTDWSFTSNLTDLNGDGFGDLVMANDFGTSQTFQNNGDGTFTRTTDRDVIIDQSGMGAAVGDFDNDGDMDWFVTSIYNLDILGAPVLVTDSTKTWEMVVFTI